MSRKERVHLSEKNTTMPANLLICHDDKMLPPKFPVLKSKIRVLANAINRDLNKTTISKAALERQRENASKLASGRSVMDKANKENQVTRNKSVKVQQPPPIKSNKSRGILEERKNKLYSADSITSLYLKEEVKKVENQSRVKPIPEVEPKVEKSIVENEKHKEKEKQEHEDTQEVKENEKIKEIKEVKEIEEIKKSDEPKEREIPPGVQLIDKEEETANCEFLLGIYADDIHKFMKKMEAKQVIRKRYLTQSHIMTPSMRSLLVDWLFEVQGTFKLLNETLHLTIALLDLFMQDNPSVQKNELQLVGIGCIFLASKYEEMYPPDLTDLVDISAKTYKKNDIIKIEQLIFSSLNYEMGRPSPSQFLRRYGRAGNVDIVTYSLAKYFVDLSLVCYSLCHVPPSLMAASALYLSMYLRTDEPESEIWTPTLKYFSQYDVDDVKPIVQTLALEVWKVPESKYQTVRIKYLEQKKMHAVSALQELKSEKLYELAHKE